MIWTKKWNCLVSTACWSIQTTKCTAWKHSFNVCIKQCASLRDGETNSGWPPFPREGRWNVWCSFAADGVGESTSLGVHGWQSKGFWGCWASNWVPKQALPSVHGKPLSCYMYVMAIPNPALFLVLGGQKHSTSNWCQSYKGRNEAAFWYHWSSKYNTKGSPQNFVWTTGKTFTTTSRFISVSTYVHCYADQL